MKRKLRIHVFHGKFNSLCPVDFVFPLFLPERKYRAASAPGIAGKTVILILNVRQHKAAGKFHRDRFPFSL